MCNCIVFFTSFSNKDSDKILVDVLKSFETEEKQQNEKLLISYYIYEIELEIVFRVERVSFMGKSILEAHRAKYLILRLI